MLLLPFEASCYLCGLFTFNVAASKLKELDHAALLDPFLHYAYFSRDYGLCNTWVDLPLKLNHMCHRKHHLLLQFNGEQHGCMICQVTHKERLVYVCSPCGFAIHIECVLPPPSIQHQTHTHPFTLIPRRKPFTCDACGTQGIHEAYICCTCNIIVHKTCTSLPPIIKSKWHDHRIFHKYFLPYDFKSSDCIICHDEVDPEHGSYCCSYCHVTFHAHCVTEDKDSYYIVSIEDEDELPYESSFTILETNDAGEATKIEHFKHMQHSLMLSPLVGGYENSCDGCMLPVSDPFYYCSECEFFLHKACAELPKARDFWHHGCRRRLTLISDDFFKCEWCSHFSKAFAYECGECDMRICLRCVVALTPGARTSSKHEHPLFYYRWKANANVEWNWGTFRCKECNNFEMDLECFSRPVTARHKCDEHVLKLIHHDDNSYSETHYCDVCEERRDPNLWSYHCATCETSAHVDCVLGEYPFVKLGSSFNVEYDHPHPLTLVKKIHYYPDCDRCGDPCEDLALECDNSGCNYIVHVECGREGVQVFRDQIEAVSLNTATCLAGKLKTLKTEFSPFITLKTEEYRLCNLVFSTFNF